MRDQLTSRLRSSSMCSWSASRVASATAPEGSSSASSASSESERHQPGKAGAGFPARMRLQIATQASQM